MSVQIDVRAALAEIKRGSQGAGPPATHATDTSPIGGAVATVDVEEFEERAGIAEYDGGLSQAEAEAAAAQAQGYADPAELWSSAARHRLRTDAMQDELSIYMTDQAGAALLDISRASFRRRVKDGTLPPPVKIGGANRWRRDELMAFVDRASAARGGPSDD